MVAIVGRPNVGKSSLFNWLAGRRISIVDPTAGVTRDRVSTLIQTEQRYVELVDTGGIGIEDVDNLTADVERQIQIAIEEAALILFVVDARAGIVPLDEEVARRLRGSKPVLLVVNKCDTVQLEDHASEFYKLGYRPIVTVSAEQKRGKDELLSQIDAHLPPPSEPEAPPDAPVMHFAIVGRQNVGKSTFINSLAQTERVIVSEVAGTTRDSIDVSFEKDGKRYIAIDTAGVRRKKSIASDIEFYSLARAQRSIRRADVVFHFFDPRLRISKVDKSLAEYTLEQYKPLIFVVNKWDLARSKMPTERFANYVFKMFPMLDFVPIAFITAKTGKNIHKLLDLALHLHKQASERVSTGDLNRVLRQALELQPPPMRLNRRPKVYYATQVATNPPTIVLFTNGPELFDKPYIRYLLNTFRDSLPFRDVPIRLHLRDKNRSEQPAGISPIDLDEQADAPVAAPGEVARPRSEQPADLRGRGKKGQQPELWDV